MEETSGCIESAKQPSPKKAVERLYVKSCKMTVHMITWWSDTSRLAN